jgi:hypothetical protein
LTPIPGVEPEQAEMECRHAIRYITSV